MAATIASWAALTSGWAARNSEVNQRSTTHYRIDGFADATGDHQWIHVDPERAAAGPYGAHRARVPHAVADPTACRRSLHDANRIGTDQLRQQHDSLPNAGHRRVAQAGAFLTVGVTIEVEGHDKPACVGECVTLVVP